MIIKGFKSIKNKRITTILTQEPKPIKTKKIINLLFINILLLQGCTGSKNLVEQDPYKRINKVTHKINSETDTYGLKPIAKGYNSITNNSVKNLINNFFENLSEIKYASLHSISLNFKPAGISIIRFALNSTFGIVGFYDVAAYLNLERKEIDTGRILSKMNFSPGPYIVLPVTGGRTTRQNLDLPIKLITNPINYTPYGFISILEVIHNRSNYLEESDLLNKIAIDDYTFTKQTYYGIRRNYLFPRDKDNHSEIYEFLFEEDFK